MRSTIELLHDAASAGEFPLVIIGGLALQPYGVARQTLDIDCMIVESDLKKLDTELKKAGYGIVGKTESFCRYHHDSIYLMDVDVLLVNRDTAGKIAADGKKSRLQDKEFVIPSILHLIAMKLFAIKNSPDREQKDMTDVSELLRLNKGVVSRSDLKDICDKYCPANLAGKVMELCQ